MPLSTIFQFYRHVAVSLLVEDTGVPGEIHRPPYDHGHNAPLPPF